MKKVIAIAFSDLHINNWNKFNDYYKRTLNSIRVLFLIKDLCKKYKCPALFCGDLLHKPENIDSDLFGILVDKFNELFDGTWEMLSINGNHDLNKVNNVDNPVSGWLNKFAKIYTDIVCIDCDSYSIGNNYQVFGIPYIDHNIGINQYIKNLKLNDKKNILLLHTDYPGAKDTDNTEVNSVENLNINILSRFDLVLCGHIHKPQRLSKKVYMVGAPNQQRRTDKDCELGYCEIYSDLSVKFIPFTDFPKFIDVDNDSDIVDDGNYYTVIKVKDEMELSTNNIKPTFSKKRIVRRYLKEKGIVDKDKVLFITNLIKEAEND